MSTTETPQARPLLTYSEAMTRLQMHYESETRIGGWQAYLHGCPTCFGACFLPTTPNASTILMARNLIMRCRLSFLPGERPHPLRFTLDER